MKSERRHELKQNVLDAELVKAYGFFRTHGRLVAWVVLGLAAVVLGYVLIQRHAQNKELAAQEDFTSLVLEGKANKSNLARLDAIIEDGSSEFRAAYACVAAGDVLANAVAVGGNDMTPQDRTDALRGAKTYYARAIEKFPDQPGAVAKAYLGLAVVTEKEKSLADARAPMDEAAKLKAKAVAGVIAQRSVQDWDELASVGAMRQSPLTPPSTQPASLLAQGEMPLPDVPLPAGFAPETPGGASRPGALRYVGQPREVDVVNFYRSQMAERGWKLAFDRPQTSFTPLLFMKGPQFVAVKISRSGALNTEIELSSGTGAAPTEFTGTPATTAPAPK